MNQPSEPDPLILDLVGHYGARFGRRLWQEAQRIADEDGEVAILPDHLVRAYDRICPDAPPVAPTRVGPGRVRSVLIAGNAGLLAISVEGLISSGLDGDPRKIGAYGLLTAASVVGGVLSFIRRR